MKKFPKIEPLLLGLEVAVPVVGLVTSVDSPAGEATFPSVVEVVVGPPVVTGVVPVGTAVDLFSSVARGAATTRAALAC